MIERVDAFVWVDSWQQQCCGEPFRVGSDVRWEVKRHEAAIDWLERLVGPEWSARIRYVEDHHGDEVDGLLTGEVAEIHAVTSGRVPGDVPGPGPVGTVYVPITGTGRLRRVAAADPWEFEPRETQTRWVFDGWVVRLTSAVFALGL
jgi:hypothetical protein